MFYPTTLIFTPVCFLLGLCCLLNAETEPEGKPIAEPSPPTPRANLPEFYTIPAAAPEELTPANDWPPADYFVKWQRSHGEPGNSRFSTLKQITKENVKDLTIAWEYRSGDLRSKTGRNIQANPIMADGVLYAPTIGHALVALDAATGKEFWRYLPDEDWIGHEGEYTAQRGLVYWPGDHHHAGRLYFNSGQHLYCLDAKTGKPVPTFGAGGRTRTGIIPVAGAIYKNVIVLPSKSETAIYGYDIHTGLRLWRFNTVPQKGELNYDPQGDPHWNVYCWGGIALDESRGIVYLGMSDTNLDQGVGVSVFLSRNLYANSILALDALTGEYVWHFQEMPHDIWDMDIPAPPILAKVKRHGKLVDVVVGLTKLGNTLILDRETGKPLYDFRMRRAPDSPLESVVTWPYQPDLELPEPFARGFEFTLDDVTDRSPEARAHVMEQIKDATYGWFQPYQKPDQLLVYYGVHGGAQWTGGSYNPDTGMLFLNSNHIAWTWGITDYREIEGERYDKGRQAYLMNCAVCHGADRLGIGHAGSLVGVSKRYSDKAAVETIIRNGIGTMPPSPMVTDDDMEELLLYLFAEGQSPMDKAPSFVYSSLQRLRDQDGLPGTKPPWGSLVALDLNTGKIHWQVPLGEHPDAPPEMQPTGVENFGGPIATATGVVFCGGTKDNLFRAFDADTGEELWRHPLPFGGHAPPSTYEVDGRQFVVIAATSGGNPGGELGDAWVAFALPE